MRRLAIVVSIFVVLSGMLAIATHDGTATASRAVATHPVVGLWRTVVSNTGPNPSPP